MRTYKYTVLFTCCLLGLMGCKKFIDVNNDPNNPLSVQESLLLAPVELNLSTVLTGGCFPDQDGLAAILVNHYMQNIALNQPVPNQGTYLLFNVDLDATWKNIYQKSLINLKAMIDKAIENGNYNYSGIGKILTAFSLGIATDYWGDIPYTEALAGNAKLQPAYDSQESIYKTIQQLLDDGIADIKKNAVVTPAGDDDYFYGGDMKKWQALAYTLKARYYMHLTKAPGHTATGQADLVLTALQNGMQSNGNDMIFKYPGGAGTENPFYIDFLSTSTLVLSSACVDTLVTRNDPRLPKLVAKAKQTGLYTGRPLGAINVGSLASYSLPGPAYGATSSPVYVFNYSEALFLKAEATLYKSGYAAAQPIYQDAIRSHMTKLGIADADINTYISSRGTLTAGNALQRIIEEKKIANFLSIENFNDWRRTGFPLLTKVPNASSDIPRRLLYPQVEILSNPRAIQTAKITDRVWWDN